MNMQSTKKEMKNELDMSFSALRKAYKAGSATPESVMAGIRERAANYKDHNIWIHLLTEKEQAFWLTRLKEKDLETHPLWGIPFAIKDNIDLEGIPTTAGCAEFAFMPTESANSQVAGFICEPCGIEGAKEITRFGGWKVYLASL